MNTFIYVVLVILACAVLFKGGATTEIPQSVKADLVWILSTCQTQAEKEYILRWDAFFNMFDKPCWELLVELRDAATYRIMVDDYFKKFMSGKGNQKKPLSTRGDVELAMAYGDANYSTPIWADPRDVRWELMFNRRERFGHGVPTYMWKTDGELFGAEESEFSKAGDIFILHWESLGLEEVCHNDTVGGLPLKVMKAPPYFKTPDRMVIWPWTDFPTFPNRDSTGQVTYTVYGCPMVAGGSLSHKTLLGGILNWELIIKQKKQVIRRDTLVGSLAAVRPIIFRADNPNCRTVSTFLNGGALQPGQYRVELSVSGDRLNAGATKKDLIIPSIYTSEGMSDLILLQSEVMTGDGIMQGIQRYGRVLYEDPLRIFLKGNPRFRTLRPYVEFSPPDSLLEELGEFQVSILPVSDSGGTAIVLPIAWSEDEAGNPYVSSTKEIRRETKEQEQDTRRGTLVYSQAARLDHSPLIFDTEIDLTDVLSQIKPGSYWLRVEFKGRLKKAPGRGDDDKSFARMAEVKITIAE